MKYAIFLLSFLILMCSGESSISRTISNEEDSTDTAKVDTTTIDTIDTTKMDTTVIDTTDTTKADTTIIKQDTLNLDTIYTVYPSPDTTIYGNQMFSYQAKDVWGSGLPYGVSSGPSIEAIGDIKLFFNNKKLETEDFSIIISKDSLLTDTLFSVNCYVLPNDSILNISSIIFKNSDSLNLTDSISHIEDGKDYYFYSNKYIPSAGTKKLTAVKLFYYFKINNNYNIKSYYTLPWPIY